MTDGSSPSSTAAASLVPDRVDIAVRAVTSLQDFRACVELQDLVWGPVYNDSIPASMMQIATYVGGIVLGAFASSGELAGFLFGLTGIVDGQPTHWSHLLAVRESARNQGVGRMLKEAQRNELARRGINRMSWTFDPLVAKNAYLNLNRLGARIVEYVPNMYGTTSSPLHYGLATDRLIVSVDTSATPPAEQPLTLQPARPVLSLAMQDGDVPFVMEERPPSISIEIPTDIHQVMEQTPETAAAWRQSVRSHFQWALENGYEATALYREPVTSRSFYTLMRRT
ncbi:MAG: GNAT family N-acetyltransferase [bacterium]